eukprot:6222253-Amphidinium_carterae.2
MPLGTLQMAALCTSGCKALDSVMSLKPLLDGEYHEPQTPRTLVRQKLLCAARARQELGASGSSTGNLLNEE